MVKRLKPLATKKIAQFSLRKGFQNWIGHK